MTNPDFTEELHAQEGKRGVRMAQDGSLYLSPESDFATLEEAQAAAYVAAVRWKKQMEKSPEERK